MKRFNKVTAILTTIMFITSLSAMPLRAQSVQKPGGDQKPIPADVMKIIQKSCSKCHIDEAMGGLRFSEWDTYTTAKQASKAGAVYKVLTDKIMPPKKFVNKNPDLAPSDADKKLVCDWAATFKAAGK
jgi:hypothetical protein